MTEGWDGLRDFDPANLKDTQHKQEDLDVAFVRCFETHEGQTGQDHADVATGRSTEHGRPGEGAAVRADRASCGHCRPGCTKSR